MALESCYVTINDLKILYLVLVTNRYIVSDCDSVGVLYDTQHYTRTPEEAAADAIKAGEQH